MPRTGDTYALPSNYLAVTGEAATAAQHNDPLEDLRDEQNLVRPIAHGGTGGSSASAARTALGLEIGSDVQAYDAGLQSIAGLTTAADKMVYTTASDTYAVADLTSAGRALLDDADASAQRTTLGLGTAAVAALLDEDDMASDDATAAPSQQSVKAYVDNEVAGAGFTVGTDTTTSGAASYTFTSLPSGVNQIVFNFDQISCNGTNSFDVRLGTSSTLKATGYVGYSGLTDSTSTNSSSVTTGLRIQAGVAGYTCSGSFTFTHMAGNKWAYSGTYGISSADAVGYIGGTVQLAGALDIIGIATSGANDFDGGTVNIAYT